MESVHSCHPQGSPAAHSAPSSYQVAARSPAPVSAKSRLAVLEALERGFPCTRSMLSSASGLSPLTLRRTCNQLLREGVTTLTYGRDPVTGHACELITPAPHAILPIVDVSERQLIWRLCTACGESVFATVQDRSGFRPLEDELELLMSRVTPVLKHRSISPSPSVPLQAPVLLCRSAEPGVDATVQRVLGTPLRHIMTPAEAVSLELPYLPEASMAESVLHLTPEEPISASLLIRRILGDPTAAFAPAPFATGLETGLRPAWRASASPSANRWNRLLALLREILYVVTPDCLILELDAAGLPEEAIRALLPPATRLILMPLAPQALSLAHRGALRLSRRALWEALSSPTK